MRFELVTVSSKKINQAQTAEVIALCSDVFRLDYSFYRNCWLLFDSRCPRWYTLVRWMEGRRGGMAERLWRRS